MPLISSSIYFITSQPIYRSYGTKATVWSALAGACSPEGRFPIQLQIFPGDFFSQYNDGIPRGSRYDTNKYFVPVTRAIKELESEA